MKFFINYLGKIITFLASASILGIVVIVFLNVVMRYIFNTGLTWSDEVSVNLFVWFIFLGGILAAIEKMHLKVDIFTNLFNQKNQKIFTIVANIFVLLAMGILLVGGIAQVEVSNNNISSATGIPFSWITVSMVVFASGVILLTVHEIIKIFFRKDEEF